MENASEPFAAAGWEFGSSILNVRHCPACPSEAEINDMKDAAKTALEELLGDDEDGLIAMYEDFGLGSGSSGGEVIPLLP